MARPDSEKFLLKDHLFNRKKVQQMADELDRAYSKFQKKAFIEEVLAGFRQRELKARIAWMAECLQKHLPSDYRKAIPIIVKALPAPSDPALSDDDFGDFIYAPYGEFVARYGCKEQYLEISLDAIYEITTRFSAEDCIRYFINSFPEETIKVLKRWSNDPHYHVRRLCSEGLRPRLPWAGKINISKEDALPVLDKLYSDRTRYVTRSVANHINDISRVDPTLAMNTLQRWKKSGKQNEKEMDFIIRHGLRSLIKEGNPRAMELLGYSPNPKVKLSDIKLLKKVKLGSSLEFSFSLKSTSRESLIVDYIIHFCNKAGELKGSKVFKLKNLALERNETVLIEKKHPMRANMTTRTIYPGKHNLEIQINGKSFGKHPFTILGN